MIWTRDEGEKEGQKSTKFVRYYKWMSLNRHSCKFVTKLKFHTINVFSKTSFQRYRQRTNHRKKT